MTKFTLASLFVLTSFSVSAFGYGNKVLRNAEVISVGCDYQQSVAPQNGKVGTLTNSAKLVVRGDLFNISSKGETSLGKFELSTAMPDLTITRGAYIVDRMEPEDFDLIRSILSSSDVPQKLVANATPISFRDLSTHFSQSKALALRQCKELKAAQVAGTQLTKEIRVANLLLGTDALENLQPVFDGFSGEFVSEGPLLCFSLKMKNKDFSFNANGVSVESCEAYLGTNQ